MAVTDGFRDFVLEQLEYSRQDIRPKRMFGAIGLYAGDLFFALIDDDTLYFKVDDETRPTFVRKKMEPFRPYGDDRETMLYYSVPASVLEDPDALAAWAADAVAVAQRALDAKRAPRSRQRKGRQVARPSHRH